MKEKDHPFYCHKTNQRKSAWNTPGYLTNTDWHLVEKLIDASVDEEKFLDFICDWLTGDERLAIFYRILGRPEGNTYCCNPEYVVNTFYPGFLKHELAKLEEAWDKHEQEQK